MIILNFIGEIDKTYVSTKLGLYISNLPDANEDNWQEYIKQTLKTAYDINKLHSSFVMFDNKETSDNTFVKRITESAKKILGDTYDSEFLIDDYIEYLAKHMICLNIDYKNNSIPTKDGEHYCFDGGSCETEPEEKILNFIRYFGEECTLNKNYFLPYCIYSSFEMSFDNEYKYIFNVSNGTDKFINGLRVVGKQIDDFLQEEDDYFWLEYLCNALFQSNNDYENFYQYMKLYSLCAMFLEKNKEKELDYKLPYLMDANIEYKERVAMAVSMRKIRNKIAHGQFLKVYQLLEDYAQTFMDGCFWFDYFEHSRNSWIISHLCYLLNDMVKKLIQMLILGKEDLVELKNLKEPEEYKLLSDLDKEKEDSFL